MPQDLLTEEIHEFQISTEQAEHLLLLQKDILELIAIGEDHQLILDDLCKNAEHILANSLASIMLFDTDHKALYVRSAPSVPESGVTQLNGLIPGETAGSCGTAVFNEKPQYVCDTFIDPRWQHLRNFAQDFNLCACWSNPIRSHQGAVVGSFALSSFEHRKPSEFHKRLLQTGASLASIVLKRQAEEEALEHAAHYDELTKLPNRLLFNNLLEHAIKKAKRASTSLAVLFIDLDNFKIINDTRGHDQGDLVLIQVADRIRNSIREEDLLARLGGDEFILLLENNSNVTRVSSIAEKILNSLEAPFILNGQNYSLSASIGISFYPHDGEDKNSLLQNADLAMYQAKAKGRNRYEFYEQLYSDLVNERAIIESELRLGLENDEFVLHYQPIYHAITNKIVSAEALVRWQHPVKGLLAPGIFIPIAEQSDLILKLGQAILRQACADGAQLNSNIQINVNLSVKQIEADCHKLVQSILNETGLPNDQLQLEVTESLIMDQGNIAITELEKLKEMGVQIAMDDFGTGHSSLAQLKTLPMDKLKIDQSFVKNLPEDKDDTVICQTIIAMGHSLSYELVAEGVETEAQKNFLIEEGCDYLQGYWLAKPMPLNELESLLAKE